MEKLQVKCGVKEFYLPFNKILYLKAEGSYTFIYTCECKFIECKGIGQYEDVLPTPPFVRVHNSYIINVNKIHIKTKTEVTLDNNTIIPVSRSKHEGLKNTIKYMQKNIYSDVSPI